MVAFRADLDQMVDLASRLASVSAVLSDESHSGLDSSVLGSGDGAGALDHFVSNWSHGRAEIVTGIKTVHDALVGASGNYRSSDQGMAAKL
jgi:hypothetical protein